MSSFLSFFFPLKTHIQLAQAILTIMSRTKATETVLSRVAV